jgi:nicotinate-nucleotide pyrophosphorylase
LREVLAEGRRRLLLDNMGPDQLREAVAINKADNAAAG